MEENFRQLVEETTKVSAEEIVDCRESRLDEFKGTEEALAYGRKATPEQARELEKKKKEAHEKFVLVMKKEDPSNEEEQQAIDYAIEGQLYGEALEAYNEDKK